ncbi:Glycerol-3-phosphate regulon repressor [Carnimonas sp. R-84981]|uniref:DeoR/GlpR family DNA-binding transcription regulator n=1 Tax=Carnimonas bestiolae TaxID=3402172 RepID=UPI003EDB8F8A
MKSSERQKQILSAVASGVGRTEALAELCNVSIATIRRDLKTLVDQNQLLRTYGGAALPVSGRAEASIEDRKSSHRDAKRAIAFEALSRIRSGEVIFLDAGTTVAWLGELISDRRKIEIKVVTNNLLIADRMSQSGIETIVAGGGLRVASMGLFGPLTELAVERIQIDRAFVSGDALSVDRGLSENNWTQAQLREKIFGYAKNSYVLACQDKFSADGMYWTPLPRGVEIITDSVPDVHIDEKELERRGITFCVAPPLE